MNILKTTITLATLFFMPVAAQASVESDSHITSYTPQAGGPMFFATDGQRQNIPGCSFQPGRWVIDDTTPAGQALVAGMLTAFSLHKTIRLVGTGDCSVWGDTETVLYFTVN